MKKAKTYRAKQSNLELNLVRANDSPDQIKIFLRSIPSAINPDAIEIDLKTLQRLGSELSEDLDNYKDNPGPESQRTLIEHGFDMYEYLLARATRASVREAWKLLLTSERNIRDSILRINFPKHATFPFGLLCTTPPQAGDNYKISAHKFLGANSIIINSFGRNQFRTSHSTFLSSNDPCLVVHAVDSSVAGADEETDFLSHLDKVHTITCMEVDDLVASWNEEKTAIVHFSSHHMYDEGISQHVLSLSNGEGFSAARDLKKLKPKDRELPFVYLNACNTGCVAEGASEPFVTVLCPSYAVGFLATINLIGGNNGAAFSKRFYQHWLERSYAVDALAATKQEFIFKQKDLTALTYEFWEMPEVLRLFQKEGA